MADSKFDAWELLKRNRADALDLSTTIGKKKLKLILKEAEASLTARLASVKSGSESFSSYQIESALRQIKDVTKTLTLSMKGLLVDQAVNAADKASGDLVDYMNRAHRMFNGMNASPLALNEASVLDRAQAGARSSILNRIASGGEADAVEENATASPAKVGILQRYGASTVEVFEQKLQIGLIAQKPWNEVRADITASSPFLQQAPAHWAERIVRTETMGAFNRSNWEAVRAADDELGDMVKILAATFDDRTGWDSYQVHGQIRLPNQAFAWSDGLYQHPPNRPNDREVVVPQRISWPIPEYLQWRTDAEVLERYLKGRKKGTPGPRPVMTTVPLNKFGK